jgi:hypothetical protein
MEFHDALFEGLSFEAAARRRQSSCRIGLQVYRKPDSSVRHRITIRAESLLSLTSSVDFRELLDYAGSGNVSYGYLKRSKSRGRDARAVFRLYLVDGYVEIVAQRFRVER